jgi:hypothetical protein
MILQRLLFILIIHTIPLLEEEKARYSESNILSQTISDSINSRDSIIEIQVWYQRVASFRYI